MEAKIKIKALIIDDEARSINMLKLLLEKHVKEVDILGFTSDPIVGLEMINSLQPELIFLDIQMPYMDGFELLKKAGNFKGEVVFTTAFNEYAIQAVRVSAIDYLLKPIMIEDLKRAIDRFLIKQKEERNWQARYENLMHNLAQQNDVQQHRLAISSLEGIVFIAIENILRCESSSNYTYFFLKNGKKQVASKTLKDFETILQEHHFIRIHKSHLVNKKEVKECLGDTLVLTDGTILRISRRRKSFVRMELKKD